MTLGLNLIDWYAQAPGVSETAQWLQWARHDDAIDGTQPQAKLRELPMMTARRLNSGSRLAVECGLCLLRRNMIDAVLYTSRHGELERNYRILHALATGQHISPTDFAMSVHNSAVGHLTINAQRPLVASSLSAGLDTFQQGLYEVAGLLHAGYQRVLMVDFDGIIPDFYHPYLPVKMPLWAYAAGFVFEAGTSLQCTPGEGLTGQEPAVVQSLQFLRHYLREDAEFIIDGEQAPWCWKRLCAA